MMVVLISGGTITGVGAESVSGEGVRLNCCCVRRIPRVDVEERRAPLHALANRRAQDDADGGVNRIVLAFAARAEAHRRPADGERLDVRDDSRFPAR